MSNFAELTKANSMGQQEAKFLLRWRGKQEGPYSAAAIEAKLAANEIGLLHEILDKGQWVSIRDYIAERETAIRAEIEANEAKKRLEQEEAARKERELAADKEREVRRRQELQAEAERKYSERASDVLNQIHNPSFNSPTNQNSTTLRNVGVLLLLLGVAVAGYFFFIFDASVESGVGRVNNLGLIADRQNGIIVGIGLGVVGAILLAIGTRNKN